MVEQSHPQVDEAVLKAVPAQILDDGFVTDITAEVNIRLAEAARRPRDTKKKLEQEIASRQWQVSRLTEWLEKIEDAGGLDTIFNKVAELNRQLEADLSLSLICGACISEIKRSFSAPQRPAGR